MEETFDIFVGSLLSCATQESLTSLFDKFGKIVKLRVMENTTSKGMKYAFIHYSTEEAALKAIEEMSDYMCSGVPLQVRKSDRWLQRIGEEKSMKGKLKRPQTKVPTNTSGTIGVWQPPNTSTTVPILGAQPSTNSCPDKGQNPSSGLQTDNTMGKIMKETIAVTHVEDPVTFYAYFGSNNNELDNLATELQTICPTLNTVSGDLVETKVYASMYSADGQWYRCKVKKLDKTSGRSLVQYIDYGNVENVLNNSLVELPHRLQMIKPYTIICTMRNLAPARSNADLYEQGLNYLKSVVIDQMVSAVLHVSGNGTFQVSEMCHNGVNIVDMMVKKGFLVHSYVSDNSNSNNYVTNNQHGSNQGSTNEKPKNTTVSHGTKPLSNNYNAVMINQEKAQLEAENKQLKREMAQLLEKQKSLQRELENLNQRLVEPNLFTELPDVVSGIERVRSVRQQLPVRSGSVDYIDTAVELLRQSQDVSRPFSKPHRKAIQEMVDQYNQLQGKILNCTDKSEQVDLINDRNSLQEKLHEKLTSFSSAVHSDAVLGRVKEFKAALQELQKIYHPFSKMQTFGFSTLPVEELHHYYTSTKAEKCQEFLGLQRKTNLAHRNFFKTLQPSSQSLDEGKSECTSVLELSQTLGLLKESLAEEIKVCCLEESSEGCTVGVLSQLLREKLEQELLEMEETECLEKQYSLLLQDLALASQGSSPPAIEQLVEKRKERKKLKSQLRHILADKMDLEENEEANEEDKTEINKRLADVHRELHRTFLEEDHLIGHIAHLQAAVFPELNNLYPDFGLQEYNKYKGFVKTGLEIEHFDLKSLPSPFPSETHYSSVFNDMPVRLQEFQIASENEKEDFLRNVLEYSSISEAYLLPVEAVFFTKKGVHAYVQQPLMQTLQSFAETKDLNMEEMMEILRGILEGLSVLHRRKFFHSRLHPSTVYLRPDMQPVLETLPFQPSKSSGPTPPLNGIQFQPMDSSSNVNRDIYSFAALCLWLMYPKTQFSVSRSGKPIIEDLPTETWKSSLIELVMEILESKAPSLQVSDVAQRLALIQDLDSYDSLEIPDDLNDDCHKIDTNNVNCNTWNSECDYNQMLSDKHQDIDVLQDIFRECLRSE